MLNWQFSEPDENVGFNVQPTIFLGVTRNWQFRRQTDLSTVHILVSYQKNLGSNNDNIPKGCNLGFTLSLQRQQLL